MGTKVSKSKREIQTVNKVTRLSFVLLNGYSFIPSL